MGRGSADWGRRDRLTTLPAGPATDSLTSPQLDPESRDTEVEAKEEHDPGVEGGAGLPTNPPERVEVGEEQGEAHDPEAGVSEEEGQTDQQADGSAGLALVVPGGGGWSRTLKKGVEVGDLRNR